MKVLVVYGTRPEVIKLAPVIQELRSHEMVSTFVLSTGQHLDLTNYFEDFFEIEVDYQANVLSKGQSLNGLFGKVLLETEKSITEFQPDIIVVQGDTTTATAAALSAFQLRVPIAHVEAGLRTFDPNNPFPEELNRVIIDFMSTFLYPPTESAAKNLANLRGDQKVLVTGNTGIDALRIGLSRSECSREEISKLIELCGYRLSKEYILVTQHRRENHGVNIEEVLEACIEIASQDLQVIFMEHPNENVRKSIDKYRNRSKYLFFIPPQPYHLFINLLKHAKLVVTDSGGIQEEAPYLGVPILVTRKVTERVESLNFDKNIISASERRLIVDGIQVLTEKENSVPPSSKYIYGDGFAAKRIVKSLVSHFNS